jgi:predicted PurR-regulated permease PerM
MPEIPSWLTFAFGAAVFGAISGFTSWLVNVNNFRKTNREIERLDEELEKANQELEKANRRLITLDDPNWERVSREVRNTFHEARETFRQMRADPISRTLSLFIFTALLVSIMFAVAMRESTRMSARLAAATSELAYREKQLADLQQQTATLHHDLDATNTQNRQLVASISQLRSDNIQAVVISAGDLLRELSKDQAQKALHELRPNSPPAQNPQEELTAILMDTTTLEDALRALKAIAKARSETTR